MDIEDIKNELHQREGLKEETLERVLEKGRGNTARPRPRVIAALACGLAALLAAAVLAALKPKGEKPGAEAAATGEPEPTQSSAPHSTQGAARRTPKPETATEVQFAEGASLYTLIDSASVIMEGEVKSLTKSETLDFVSYAEFEVKECIRGELEPGDTVTVRANCGEQLYSGESYLLMTNPMGSVYEGKELFYQLDSYFSSVRSTEFSVLEGAKGAGFEELVEKVRSYAAINGYTGSGGTGFYCTSEDIGDIVDFSDTVVRVRVREASFDSTPDRTTYSCEVLECLKGGARGDISAVTLKHAMESGGEYLLLLTHVEDELYRVSSRNSVFAADGPEAAQVKEKLG